jgi:preprotein translocase subunit SecG
LSFAQQRWNGISMFSILLAVQIIVSISLIVLVLLQHGKGADMGAAFGSGSSGTVFGSRGSSSFFTRATAVLATVFFINCLLIASPLIRDSNQADDSIADQLEQQLNGLQPALDGTEPEAVMQEQQADVPSAEVEITETIMTEDDLPGDIPAPSDGAVADDLPQ